MNAALLDRRVFLGAVATLVPAAATASPAGVLAGYAGGPPQTTGPIRQLANERKALIDYINSAPFETDEEADPSMARWTAIDDELVASTPTSADECLALCEVGLIDFAQFMGEDPDNGDLLVLAALRGAIAHLRDVH